MIAPDGAMKRGSGNMPFSLPFTSAPVSVSPGRFVDILCVPTFVLTNVAVDLEPLLVMRLGFDSPECVMKMIGQKNFRSLSRASWTLSGETGDLGIPFCIEW